MPRGVSLVLLRCCWLWLALVPLAGAAGEERLLTPDDLAALDRQSAMWRLVRPEEDVEANLRRWREAGCTSADVAALSGQLAALWHIGIERYYGWLDAATIERIAAVDREFVVRLRALRLHQATGITAGPPGPRTITALNVLWRRAILRVLDDDELGEFRLMNSGPAREISRLLEGIPRSTAEDRRLFQLERDFQLAYAAGDLPGPPRADRHYREARLDHLMAIREVLGDGRFAAYLSRADPDFAGMREALGRLAPEDATLAVDLWRVRQKDGIARLRQTATVPRTPGERDAEVQAAALDVLGPDRFSRYMQEADAGWLVSVRRAPLPPMLRPPPAGR